LGSIEFSFLRENPFVKGFILVSPLEKEIARIGRREAKTQGAIDREMRTSLMNHFEKFMAEGPSKKAPSPPAGEEGAYP